MKKFIAKVVLIACPTGSHVSAAIPTLRALGTKVLEATDGRKALELVRYSGVELIVLAEPLEGLSSLAVCSLLREACVGAPLILLGTPESTVLGLDAGADVVLPQDSKAEIVLAQIHALLRRAALDRSPLQVADLSLDTATRRATRAGRLISLSTTEYTLLELLMRRVGQVVSREEIMEHVWPGENRASDNVLDVYVSYLRTKVDKDFPSSLIRTVRGQGYRIASD